MSAFVDTRNYVKSIFPERFKELRNAIGISQEDFAKALGVSRASIGYYESGSRLPDAAFLAILSDLTGCDVGFLLGSNPNMVRNAPSFVAEYDLSDAQYEILDKLLSISTFREFLCYSDVVHAFSNIDDFRKYASTKKHGPLVQSVVEYTVVKELSSVIQDICTHARYISIYGDRDIEEVNKELDETRRLLYEQVKQVDEEAEKRIEENLKQFVEAKGNRSAVIHENPNVKIEMFRDKLLELSKIKNEVEDEK